MRPTQDAETAELYRSQLKAVIEPDLVDIILIYSVELRFMPASIEAMEGPAAGR